MKNKFFSSREFRAKFAVSICLLALLILSFFFAVPLETAFGLNYKYDKNETSAEAVALSSFEVTYIDVGQGNSCYVRFPDGKNMLVDGGTAQYGSTVVDFLKSKNVSQIDYLIATHADSDHIGGLNSVIENFEVKSFYRPFQIAGSGSSAETFVPNAFEDLSDIYYDLNEQKLYRSKISRITTDDYNKFIEYVYTETYTENSEVKNSSVYVFYDDLSFGGTNYSVEFFAPLKRNLGYNIESNSSRTKGEITVGYGTTNSNDNSAIFLLKILNYSYLFTGDATFRNSKDVNKEGKFEETDFLASLSSSDKQKLKNTDVVLAGHHGSSYSTSAELLNLTAPRFVVFSVGEGNSFGHPSSEVIFRAEATKNVEVDYLLRTDKNGNITFGEENGKLKYSVQTSNVLETLSMSWFEFSCIIFLFFEMCVIFIRPIKFKRAKIHWHIFLFRVW